VFVIGENTGYPGGVWDHSTLGNGYDRNLGDPRCSGGAPSVCVLAGTSGQGTDGSGEVGLADSTL